jgi:hypothetical protein
MKVEIVGKNGFIPTEANKDYVERVAKEKEYEEAYKANLAESMSNLEKMQQEQGMTDEQADELVQFLVGIYQDVVMGKFTPEALEMARKALHHDEDVATASHEAEVRGRNEKIEVEKKRMKCSGLPDANAGGSVQEEVEVKPKSSTAAWLSSVPR